MRKKVCKKGSGWDLIKNLKKILPDLFFRHSITFTQKTCTIKCPPKLQQGVRFDPDMPQTIRLEFAKSNTKGKKGSNQDDNISKKCLESAQKNFLSASSSQQLLLLQ
jgi:hypothetical protein